LKKYDFVYILNPKPKKSFYFTGNPTKISSDYFGYTEYDINRNSSPGACRTVPIENIEIVDNVNGETEDYEPYSKIDLPNRFDTISEFLDWFNNDYFKIMKKTLERFSKDY
jgi:hypothetical protein